MKNLSLFLLCLLVSVNGVFAQAKRYILLEHFTNSRCPICGSQNPSFYATIAQNAKDVHHISYHPVFPYSTCVFYQANKSENTARTDFYGIQGTPTVVSKGKYLGGTSSITANMLTTESKLTSPVEIKVNETKGTNSIAVGVKVRKFSALTGTNIRLFVALVEKEINYNAPNGEKLHHDVFRKMATTTNGVPILNEAGEETFNYTVNLDAAWNSGQVYAIAFVQDMTTKEVFNSGTKFDGTTTSNHEIIESTAIDIYPTPAREMTIIDWSTADFKPTRLSLYNHIGQLLQEYSVETATKAEIMLNNYPAGIYLVLLRNQANQSVVKEFVKN